MVHTLQLCRQILLTILQPCTSHIRFTYSLNFHNSTGVTQSVQLLKQVIQKCGEFLWFVLGKDGIEVNYVDEDDGYFSLVFGYVPSAFFNPFFYEVR